MEDNTVSNGLKRRNSVPSAVVIPARLETSSPNGNHLLNSYKLTNSSSPTTLSAVDFKLVSLDFPSPASYTSLKDIIPSSPLSMISPSPAIIPSGSAASSPSFGGSGYEISIRNRLVKQAAWAYLQPTVPSSPSSSSSCFCFSSDFYRPIITRFRQFLCETVTRVHDWLMDLLWLILCR